MKRKDLRLIGILTLALLLAAFSGMACAEETWVIEQEEELFFPTVKGEPEALFAGYVDALFNGAGSQTHSANYAGAQLTGNDAILYGELKRSVMEIANGDRSSTVITYSPDIFGVEGNDWTAEELGVEAIVKDGKLTEEAKQAVRDRVGANYDRVLKALLRDCAYEMFWYDKTNGLGLKSYYFSYGTMNGEYFVGWRGDCTVRFPVCEEYAVETYTVDTDQIELAKTAAGNAREIVKRYKNASDLDKLNGYRQEICALVSYNFDAVYTPGTPYGNPWQMIWVFDGDPETEVVCEGYAKAFQYLCEQTKFASDKIKCIQVDGSAGVGGGLGAHMWNVLCMDDGKNYIADITNCDDDHIGSPDRLFLSGCAGGSVEDGYTYLCYGYEVYYRYNSDTLSMYPASWLKLTSRRYGETDPWENLDSVTLPADIREIQAGAFEGAGMEMVTLPEGVRVIGERAFALCANLRYVYLPESLTSIADTAFDGCENLTVLCVRNGAAEAYALAHGFACAYPED